MLIFIKNIPIHSNNISRNVANLIIKYLNKSTSIYNLNKSHKYDV